MGNCMCSGDESQCSTPFGGVTFKHCGFSCTRKLEDDPERLKRAAIRVKLAELEAALQKKTLEELTEQ